MAVNYKVSLDDVVDIDYNGVRQAITQFLRKYLEASGASGYVLGVSGGVDSSLALALAVDAVGSGRVTALIMPDREVTPERDVEDALRLVRSFGVEHAVIDISPIVMVYISALPIFEDEEKDRVPVGNLRARIRANILYYYANKLGKLVLGTGDRSEYLIGYFTKYGDAACDVAPLTVLYKSQVRRLAELIGVPRDIAYKPSSPRLWKGHEAEAELGLSYNEIDVILYSRFDLKIPWEEIPRATGLERAKVERVRLLHEASSHKRSPPASPDLGEIKKHYKQHAGKK
ncbi:NH(3)-dependent NAD(+) synthetase [Aeropyrum pernix K1]|uniref:NH(3)-dependent NAD(+) synthetase n=1 Tax=Aeropyrum pernix (strain ATCC 700893 / DSM 11879 / JCM 9820 / NBRC 100138 / K1) TaxID=272557 RepID=NADE_AERPE|nr:NAD+ synthase [Aeropyrum pernix]Q9YAI1.3 RecName: Full=NH(3)-dependent NAD(+) synthetase [Aeropyrum pernix K1]BAA80968.2 NH(3)-dependent NAD(+) synthetase [Aeropyrum pernix K1]